MAKWTPNSRKWPRGPNAVLSFGTLTPRRWNWAGLSTSVRCMTCHGVNGDGKPVTPEYLSVPPRDFTGQSHAIGRLTFKFTSLNWSDPLALDEDLEKTIREGLPGTPMPGFQDLTDEEMDAVMDYIKSFGYGWWKYQRPSEGGNRSPGNPFRPGLRRQD